MSDLQTDIEIVNDGFGCQHTTHRQYEALESVVAAAREWLEDLEEEDERDTA